MTTEEKLKVLLTKLTSQRNQRFLKDIQENGLSFGRFTLKQTEMIDRMYLNISQKSERAKTEAFKETLCEACNGVGVLAVLSEGIESLALCDCPQGENQPWALPSFTDLKIEKKTALPIKWFKPQAEPINQDQTQRFIKEKVSWWVTKIRLAEETWKNFNLRDEATKPVSSEAL